jgi:hypothetical protein
MMTVNLVFITNLLFGSARLLLPGRWPFKAAPEVSTNGSQQKGGPNQFRRTMLKVEYESEAMATAEWLADTMNTVVPATGEIAFPASARSELTGRLEGTSGP